MEILYQNRSILYLHGHSFLYPHIRPSEYVEDMSNKYLMRLAAFINLSKCLRTDDTY